MAAKRTIQSVEQTIGSFFRQHRRMPTYTEMIEILEVRSKSVVHFWVNKLIQSGFLEKDGKGFLKPTRMTFGVPMAGSVQAGFPTRKKRASATSFPSTNTWSRARNPLSCSR